MADNHGTLGASEPRGDSHAYDPDPSCPLGSSDPLDPDRAPNRDYEPARHLASLFLGFARVDLYSDCVVSVFPDGRTVPACPNGSETWVHTACHEIAHHLAADLVRGAPSACLRMVADGERPRWTPERLDEEEIALRLGPILDAIVRAVALAYLPRTGVQA